MQTGIFYPPRRVRRPLLPVDPPKPVGADAVCPLCGRPPVLVPPAPPIAPTVKEQPPAESTKPKAAHDDAPEK